MSKTAREILNTPMDIELEKNPNRTSGLEAALEETSKKYPMSVAELREASQKLRRNHKTK